MRVITELVINHTSRPASLVPARARSAKPGSARARLLRLVRHRPEIRRHAHHLPRHRAVQLDLGPGRRRLLLAPLLFAPARPQLRQPARAGGSARRHALLARPRRRRAAARRRALPGRARGHQQREPAGDARRPASGSAPSSTQHYPDRMLLAEANQWPEDTQDYFGDGDECHMAFHFPLMPRMYMAHRARGPLPDHRHPAPDAGHPGQLPVGDLPAQPRRADAGDGDRSASATTCGRPMPPTGARASISASAAGWRRCCERDRRRIELMNCLLLSMPGTPVIYYGDEIGMGDNIHLGDRDGVRTPMQWSPDRNGGFSRADPAALVLPPIMDPLYGYQAVNVEAQARDPHSLLNWMRRMLAVRKRSTRVRPRQPCGCSIRTTARCWPICASTRASTILCVANLSRTPQAVELDLSDFAGRVPVEMHRRLAVPADRPAALPADPAALRLLLVRPGDREAQLPPWHTPAPEPLPDYAPSCCAAGSTSSLGRRRAACSSATCCRPICRSAAGSPPRTRGCEGVRLVAIAALPEPAARAGAGRGRGQPATAASSASCCRWPSRGRSEAAGAAAGAARAGARAPAAAASGCLTDAFAAADSPAGAARACAGAPVLETADGEIRFAPTPRAGATSTCRTTPEIRWLSAEQSNSSLIVDDARGAEDLPPHPPGIHPEAEMGALPDRAGLRQHAAAAGRGGAHRTRDGDADTLLAVAAGLRAQPGRCLELDADWLRPRRGRRRR